MNRLLFYALLVVLAFLFVAALRAQPSNPPPVVTLAWTPSASPASNVMGYWLWQGTSSSNYARALFVPGAGTTNATLTNVLRGQTYFFNITALGTNAAAGLESGYNGEASANVAAPPNPATGLKIIAVP